MDKYLLTTKNVKAYAAYNLENKKTYNNKDKFKVTIINLISLIFFIFAYYLYYLSLEKCSRGLDRCSLNYKWIKIKIREGIYCSFILIILIEFLILKILSKFHFLHLIIAFISFYWLSHGIEFNDHGFFNFFGILGIILIGLFLLIPFNIFIYLIIAKKTIYILIYPIFILTQILIIYNYLNSYINCKDWNKGLNNTSIENNDEKYGCQIIFPKLCLYKLGKYFFDMTKNHNFECGKTDAKEKLLYYSKSPYINKNTTRFGYPLTNKDPFFFKDFPQEDWIARGLFFTKCSNNLIDMDNKTLLERQFKNEIPEMIVDFSKNPNGEVKINLNFNKSLSILRKKDESKVNPYSENIMILYIDSVSRGNGLRQLKKSTKFFEKFMAYEGGFHPKYQKEKYHSFQFFKYHAFLGHTANNYPKIFYGDNRGKNIVRITKYLKENGYITGLTSDSCQRDLIRTEHIMKLEEVCDHEMIICDPNMMHLLTLKKRCLYNKLASEHQYEYGNQFWRKYNNNRKFLAILDCSGHEGTLEALKYQDDIIYNFLNNLYNDNLLKKTTVIFLSDHGVVIPSIYFFLDFYQLESHLPMLYIMINDRENISYEKQYKYIYQNQQILITAYDIFNTIGNIIYGDKYNYIKAKSSHFFDTPKTRKGTSLLMKMDAKSRSPLKYEGMDRTTCITKK